MHQKAISLFVIAFFLAGCQFCQEQQRWSAQWNALGRWEVSDTLEETAPMNQIVGVSGYRFGVAGAVIWIRLDPQTMPAFESHAVESVRLVADADAFKGNIFKKKDGSLWLLGWTDRLTLREWTATPLLFERVDNIGRQFFIPLPAGAWDLDRGRWLAVPFGSHAYNCVAAEARQLAREELARVDSDKKSGRLTTDEVNHVANKLEGYLRADANPCI